MRSCSARRSLAWRLWGELADLVEEEGAAAGELEAAGLVLDGSGEGALDVAEELGFEEFAGQSGAVDLDQRSGAPERGVVQAFGHELLAGAGFAEDEHGGLARADLLDEFLDREHTRALADEVDALAAFDLLFQGLVLAGQAGEAPGLVEHGLELVVVRGLGQVVEGAFFHGVHGASDGAVGGEQDHGQVGAGDLQLAQDLDAAHAGHAHVEEHDVGLGGRDGGQGGLAVGGLGHCPAAVLEHGFDHEPVAGLVVDHQDLAFAHHLSPCRN